MSIGARVLVFALVGATLSVAAGVGLATASIATEGTIAVDVQEHRGDRFSVNVPAGLVSLALFFTSSGSTFWLKYRTMGRSGSPHFSPPYGSELTTSGGGVSNVQA